jgi:hypothetical protein
VSIKIKHKNCRGTSKAIGLGCGEIVLFRKWGLCRGCLSNFYMNTPKGKEELLKASLKVSAPRKSLEKAIEFDKETKGISSALIATRMIVHQMVRLRDKYKPCISCDCNWNKEFQAGHFYPTKVSTTRFNFHNINGQCFECNNLKDGNEYQYSLRLPERIGLENYKKIQELAEMDKKGNTHWLKSNLNNIRKEARLIIKQIN